MFSGIFIDRARFAIVIAVVIALAGLIAKRQRRGANRNGRLVRDPRGELILIRGRT
jgi:hypothetical protein